MHPVRIVLFKKKKGNIELALVTRERQRGGSFVGLKWKIPRWCQNRSKRLR